MRIFLATFIAVFLIVIAQHLLDKPSTFVSPFFEEVKKADILEDIKPKLEQNKGIFNLKRSSNFIATTYAGGDFEEVSAYGVIDFETGEVLFEKDASRRLPIASITKVMSAVVVLDLASPDELFTVSEKAADIEPTKIGVIAGQKMSVKELLNAMLLTSANDASQVVADGIDQKYNDSSQSLFIKAMNEKAKYLGLKNTSFANPQGFDSFENYSSVEDLAILSQYALNNYPLIAEIVKNEYQFLPQDQNHKQFDLYNWNGLLGVYPGVWGIKIGNTGEAQYTTTVIANRDGKNILVILLGAPGVKERDLWASELLDIGFEKSLGLKPIVATEEQFLAKYKTWKYFN